MFSIAILIGIYSYVIFCLGLLGMLGRGQIITVSLVYLLIVVLIHLKQIKEFLKFSNLNIRLNHNYFYLALFSLLVFQFFVNLVGALGPELGFDALWYHLTIPKIYLSSNSIFYIPGNLLHYSAMPKLGEMLFLPAISFSGEILVKIISLLFGVLTSSAIYSLSRKYFDKTTSLMAVVIFYSNLVVAWQSTTGYVDLIRTFFELIALWGFVNWWETGKKQWLIESGIILGLAASTKIISLLTLPVFLLFILYKYRNDKQAVLANGLTVVLSSLIAVSPWLIFSFIYTGNPFFPIFTNLAPAFNFSQLNPVGMASQIFTLFTSSSDPISPVYLIFLPLILLSFKKLKFFPKLLLFYSLFSLIFLFLIPTTDKARFYMPYLPAFSILVASLFPILKKEKLLKYFFLSIVLTLSMASIAFRGAAVSKYIPVVLGMQTRDNFLINNLNFSFGDFYDVDGYLKKNIDKEEKVLLYGFHNLYYVDFPFIDSSWVKKGDRFKYIAVQNGELPSRFKGWTMIYKNDKNHVKLYSLGGLEWSY